MKIVEVVAAIIVNKDKILCVQRNKSKYEYISYKWEFPGGKVDEGETLEEAIIREIKEELRVSIKVKNHFITVKHKYPDFEITMHSYICEIVEGDIILEEHIDMKWLEKSELLNQDWAGADIPIVNELINKIKSK